MKEISYKGSHIFLKNNVNLVQILCDVYVFCENTAI